MVKHLFFDLDNTILDFSYASHYAFREVLETYKVNGNPDDLYHIYEEGNAQVWKSLEKGEITAEELRRKRFDLFLNRIERTGDGYEWNSAYLQSIINHTRFIEGAEEALHLLRKKYKIHIITNGLREVQRPRIAIAGLDHYVKSITVSDEIGFPKPSKHFFDIAMKNANLSEKAQVMVIGDNHSSDIIGGHNYGLHTCFFNPHNKTIDEPKYDFEIREMSALESVLENF